MRNITLTCPKCGEPSRCVGDPDEQNAAMSGEFYCFNCKAHGHYDINYQVKEEA